MSKAQQPPTPRPAFEERVGPTRVAVWKNKTDSGDHFYRTTVEHTYRVSEDRREGEDDSGFRSTASLPPESVIVARELLGRAVDWMLADQSQDSHK